jgi:hypothetical protein
MTQMELRESPAIDPNSMLARVAGLFMRCRGEWIDSEVIAGIGGRCAWRTRVSECRTLLGMDIKNRLRRIKKTDGTSYTVSE